MKIPAFLLIPFAVLLLIIVYGVGNNDTKQQTMEMSTSFQEYWMRGEAELTSYELEQARYGEIHKGQAVLVFVTEDFSKSKQVKLDNPQLGDAVKVLKLNLTKKFNTGIYPYSIMKSVFSPIDVQNQPHALKITTSSQEWCGHTFMQLNQKKSSYEVEVRSYFESEGDQSFSVDKIFLEDEIWTWIRLNPQKLPVGDVTMIPGTVMSRLRHLPLKAISGTASLEKRGEQSVYTLKYSQRDYELSIVFNQAFPHEIVSWQESYVSGWGKNERKMTTTARLNKRIKLDYWNKNRVMDSTYKSLLGLY